MLKAETATNDTASPLAVSWAAAERYLLYVMVFSLPLQGLAILPGTDITVTKAGGAMLIAIVTLRHVVSRRLPRIPYPLALATGLFLIACLLSIPQSVDRQTSVSAAATFVVYAVTLFTVLLVASSKRVQNNVIALYVGAAVLSSTGAVGALFGFLNPTLDRLIPAANVRRIAFGMFDANEQALLLLFALSFVLFDPFFTDRRRRFISGLALGLILAGLLLTMSRTGWALALLLSGWRVMTLKHRAKYIGLALLTVTVTTALLVVIRPGVVSDVQRRIVEPMLIGDQSSGSRAVHLVAATDFARNAGPFGYGLRTTPELSREFRDPLGRAVGQTVHNVPLNIWIETGWVGLLIFFWLWGTVIALLLADLRRTKGTRQQGRVTAYTAALTTYGLVSLVMPFIYLSSLPILLGCALGVALPGHSDEQTRNLEVN